MKKLTVGTFAAIAFLLLFVTFYSYNAKTAKENMVRARGQARVEDQTQILTSGRIGEQDAIPARLLDVSGLLLAGSCPDRSNQNLHSRPESLEADLPAEPPQAQQNNPPQHGAVAAGGVVVSSPTIAAERTDILPHQEPDIRTRQDDPTCAITASTSAFSLLMNDGRFVDLDEGGNTLAAEAILGDPAGRAMLNGEAPGLKPHVVLKGWFMGDRLVVAQLLKIWSAPRPAVASNPPSVTGETGF